MLQELNLQIIIIFYQCKRKFWEYRHNFFPSFVFFNASKLPIMWIWILQLTYLLSNWRKQALNKDFSVTLSNNLSNFDKLKSNFYTSNFCFTSSKSRDTLIQRQAVKKCRIPQKQQLRVCCVFSVWHTIILSQYAL